MGVMPMTVLVVVAMDAVGQIVLKIQKTTVHV
jgi:hypothetical protein